MRVARLQTRRDVDRELAGEVVNLTLVHVSDKRSRLVAVNKYMTMCEWDYYVSSPHKCYGGADRWIGYINKVHNGAPDGPEFVLASPPTHAAVSAALSQT